MAPTVHQYSHCKYYRIQGKHSSLFGWCTIYSTLKNVIIQDMPKKYLPLFWWCTLIQIISTALEPLWNLLLSCGHWFVPANCLKNMWICGSLYRFKYTLLETRAERDRGQRQPSWVHLHVHGRGRLLFCVLSNLITDLQMTILFQNNCWFSCKKELPGERSKL